MTCTPNTTTGTLGTGALWQNLADALNALVDAGQFPDFHNLKGSRNNQQYQPYAADDARPDAPWVVFDLTTRRFTVSSRGRTLSGEHSRRTRARTVDPHQPDPGDERPAPSRPEQPRGA